MTAETFEKLKRRLDHLRGVLEDNKGDDPNDYELVALYHSLRDIQPGVCAAMAEQFNEDWRFAYRGRIRTDEEQIRQGDFLWPEELKDPPDPDSTSARTAR